MSPEQHIRDDARRALRDARVVLPRRSTTASRPPELLISLLTIRSRQDFAPLTGGRRGA
jgi:hypothetical protein